MSSLAAHLQQLCACFPKKGKWLLENLVHADEIHAHAQGLVTAKVVKTVRPEGDKDQRHMGVVHGLWQKGSLGQRKLKVLPEHQCQRQSSSRWPRSRSTSASPLPSSKGFPGQALPRTWSNSVITSHLLHFMEQISWNWNH